jgi:hypothetical protein
MLKKEEVHFFNDIAYYHVPFTHCPTGDDLRKQLRCHCNPKENFDWKGYSCKPRRPPCIITYLLTSHRHVALVRSQRVGEAEGMGEATGLDDPSNAMT